MHIYKPTYDDLEFLTWRDFLEVTRMKFWVLTHEQWAALLGNGLETSVNQHDPVKALFETKPVIGITPEGGIVIRTHVTFKDWVMDSEITWITAWWIATTTNTTEKVVSVDITNRMVTNTVLESIKELLSITTDFLMTPPVTFYTHGAHEITMGSYIYSLPKIQPTPLPENVHRITGFVPLQGNGANTVEARDEYGMTYSGTWDPFTKTVKYDPITAVDHPSN